MLPTFRKLVDAHDNDASEVGNSGGGERRERESGSVAGRDGLFRLDVGLAVRQVICTLCTVQYALLVSSDATSVCEFSSRDLAGEEKQHFLSQGHMCPRNVKVYATTTNGQQPSHKLCTLYGLSLHG